MPIITVSRIKTVIHVLFSALYAYRLASFPPLLLSDRYNYMLRYEMATTKLTESPFQILLFNEPFYTILNKILGVLNDPMLATQVISFSICFSFCFFALNYINHWYLSVIFLLIIFFEPNTLILQLNALRQGIAISILFIFFQFKSEITYKNLIATLAILGLFHLSFLLIAFLVFVDYLLMKKTTRFKYFKRIFAHSFFAIFLSIVMLIILDFLGAKQARSISTHEYSVSGLNFVFWLIVLLYILIMKPLKYNDKNTYFIHLLAIIILVFYLGSYFFTSEFIRLLSVGIPFVIYIILYRPKLIDILFSLGILLKAIYEFFFTDRMGIFIYTTLDVFFRHLFGIEIMK